MSHAAGWGATVRPPQDERQVGDRLRDARSMSCIELRSSSIAAFSHHRGIAAPSSATSPQEDSAGADAPTSARWSQAWVPRRAPGPPGRSHKVNEERSNAALCPAIPTCVSACTPGSVEDCEEKQKEEEEAEERSWDGASEEVPCRSGPLFDAPHRAAGAEGSCVATTPSSQASFFFSPLHNEEATTNLATWRQKNESEALLSFVTPVAKKIEESGDGRSKQEKEGKEAEQEEEAGEKEGTAEQLGRGAPGGTQESVFLGGWKGSNASTSSTSSSELNYDEEEGGAGEGAAHGHRRGGKVKAALARSSSVLGFVMKGSGSSTGSWRAGSTSSGATAGRVPTGGSPAPEEDARARSGPSLASIFRAKSSGGPGMNKVRMSGIESERGIRPSLEESVDPNRMSTTGGGRSPGSLRKVDSDRALAKDKGSGITSLRFESLQSSASSSSDLQSDDYQARGSVDTQMERNLLETQLNDLFHSQKKNSLAFISFFKNANKYSDTLLESSEVGSEMTENMLKIARTAPHSDDDCDIIESMAMSWGGLMQLQKQSLRPLFVEDEFAEKFQLYEGVADIVALEKEYKKRHSNYTHKMKKYEKSIRKERTKKNKQNQANILSDSIDMKNLQAEFDLWRAQMLDDLIDMERARQARFAQLFWQNLDRQLEHYRTFLSLLEKEKENWESRFRNASSQKIRTRLENKHNSADAASHSKILSRSPKGVAFAADTNRSRKDTDSDNTLTSDSEVTDPFVEEVDNLLKGELEERTRRLTASQYKTSRSSEKRKSTIALASQLLDWCFQTDTSETMPIVRKCSSPTVERNVTEATTTSVTEKQPECNESSTGCTSSVNNNGSDVKPKAVPETEQSSNQEDRRLGFHSTDDLLDSIFDSDSSVPVKQISASTPNLPSMNPPSSEPESLKESGSKQWLSSISSKTNRNVSIGSRRRTESGLPALGEPQVSVWVSSKMSTTLSDQQALRELLLTKKIRFDELNIDASADLFERFIQQNGGLDAQLPLMYINDKCVGNYQQVIELENSGKLDYLLQYMPID